MNRIFFLPDSAGIGCECGNRELVPQEGSYKKFSVWWDTSSNPSKTMAACLACHGSAQNPLVQSSSVPNRERT